MSATPEDRRIAHDMREAMSLVEEAAGVTGRYDDERTTYAYMDYCGECNMTKALRWQELQNEGKTPEEAHVQVQQEFVR